MRKNSLNSFRKGRTLRFGKAKLNIFHKFYIFGIETALHFVPFHNLMFRCSFRAWNKTLAKVSKLRNKNKRGVVSSAPGVTFINFNCTQSLQMMPWQSGLACLTCNMKCQCRGRFETGDHNFFF